MSDDESGFDDLAAKVTDLRSGGGTLVVFVAFPVPRGGQNGSGTAR